MKQIILDLEDKDVQIVEKYEGDASGVLQILWKEKVKNLKERLISDTVKNSIEKSEAIPAGVDAIIDQALKEVPTIPDAGIK